MMMLREERLELQFAASSGAIRVADGFQGWGRCCRGGCPCAAPALTPHSASCSSPCLTIAPPTAPFDSWIGKICWRTDRLPTLRFLVFPCGSAGKESACNVGDLGSTSGLGRSPGEGKGYPLQYSCLENPTDRGAVWAAFHGVERLHFHFLVDKAAQFREALLSLDLGQEAEK